MSRKGRESSGDVVELRIPVSKGVYRAWLRAKAEMMCRSNAECLKKMLMKLGFYTDLDEFTCP